MDQTYPDPVAIDKYFLEKLHADVDFLLSASGLSKPAPKRSDVASPSCCVMRSDPAMEAAYLDLDDKPSIYSTTNRKPSNIVPAKPVSHP